jgi:selenide,water dikinase
VKRVLLVGGGHAHAWALREGIPGEVTLVSPYPRHTYSGMLPGYVAGHYSAEALSIDLAGLAARAGATLVLGKAVGMDAAHRRVRLEDGRALEYDVASLDVGSVPAMSVPGSAEHVVAVKPFEAFVAEWEALKGRARRVAVVGGGAAGMEMSMSIAHASRVKVVTYSDQQMFRPALARRLERQLERCGVELRAGTAVTALEAGPVVVTAQAREDFDLVVWAAGAAALPWLAQSGLAVDDRGFVLVDEMLHSVSHPEVFAAGDCATLREASHPKSGVFAVRHGQALAAGLRGERRRYALRRRALSLISCGRRYAIAQWGPLLWEGEWVWRWKDRIDRRWVNGFRP